MKKHIDKFFAAIVTFMAWQMYQHWLDWRGYMDLFNVATSHEIRPFVYRVLVPMLSQMLDWITHVGPVQSMAIVLMFFSIVMYYSIKYLYETFAHDGRGSVVSVVGCLALFVIMIQESKVYDIPTAAFFALCLALLARGKFMHFYAIYPFATLNRETTFLLSAFYVLYYFRGPISKRHWFFGSLYQILVYCLIRFTTMIYFADLPGAGFVVSLQYLLRVYSVHYLLTFAYLICLSWILYLTIRRWDQKPSFLRAAFLIIFPMQVVLHFMLGWPFEVRVFAESVPIFSVLAMIPVTTTTRYESDETPILSGSLVMSTMADKPEQH